MPRRSRADLEAEFHRLRDIFEAIAESVDEETMAKGGWISPSPRPSRKQGLELVGEGRVTMSQLCAGIHEAVNDEAIALMTNLSDQPQFAAAVLGRYQERTGRSFWSDAGDPRKIAGAIMKRGYIVDGVEFRLIVDLLGDVDGQIISDSQRKRAERMVTAYEKA